MGDLTGQVMRDSGARGRGGDQERDRGRERTGGDRGREEGRRGARDGYEYLGVSSDDECGTIVRLVLLSLCSDVVCAPQAASSCGALSPNTA